MKQRTALRESRRSAKIAGTPPLWRFTVDDYHRMGEAGILHEDDRVELIEGVVVQMTPIGGPHVSCVIFLENWFGERVRGRALVSVQNPVRLSEYREPQPDLVLLRPRPDYYRDKLPAAEDVLLLIEVSDTSIGYDKRTKLPLYAQAGIPEVWIADVNGKRIESHREPAEGRYQLVTIYEQGETISPLAFPDLALPVAELF